MYRHVTYSLQAMQDLRAYLKHYFKLAQALVMAINCESVKYGLFGNLEVISKTAFSILAVNTDRCDKDTRSPWAESQKNR